MCFSNSFEYIYSMLFFCALTGFADAAIEPIDFPTAPAYAIPKVSQGLQKSVKCNSTRAFL